MKLEYTVKSRMGTHGMHWYDVRNPVTHATVFTSPDEGRALAAADNMNKRVYAIMRAVVERLDS